MCFHLLLLRGLSAFSCPAPRPAPGRSTAHTSRCPLARPLRLQVCTCPIRAPLDPAPPSPALAWAPWDLQTGRRDPDPAAVMWKTPLCPQQNTPHWPGLEGVRSRGPDGQTVFPVPAQAPPRPHSRVPGGGRTQGPAPPPRPTRPEVGEACAQAAVCPPPHQLTPG